MVSKLALVGLVILVVGLVIGIYGVYTPVTAQQQSNISLLNTQASVDANDYSSKNLVLNQGQSVQLSVSIQNTTMFHFFIMNQTQYYTFYGCAPWCYAAANISGVGPVGPQNLTSMVNVTNISPSSSYSHTFTAPANGTYYFVLDNTIGPSWATYTGQNASVVACNTPSPFKCNTVVTLQISGSGTIQTSAANWTVVGIGVALLLVGGGLATATWGSTTRPKTPPTRPVTTPTVTGKTA